MTRGLLVSRMRKINLHKLALHTPTVENTDNYKFYQNMYNKLIRASKKLFYCDSLHKAKKILKNKGNSK
jgi:hypothetical protein